VKSIETHKEEVSIWRLRFVVSQGRKDTCLGKFKKRWFGPFMVQYCLPNNIVHFVFVNNFESNLVLVNINKLKSYKYVDQTLKGIQSSKN
jgi:hypothetical protein